MQKRNRWRRRRRVFHAALVASAGLAVLLAVIFVPRAINGRSQDAVAQSPTQTPAQTAQATLPPIVMTTPNATQPPEAQTPEEQTPEEQSPKEQTPEEQSPKEQTPEEQSPETETPEAQAPEAQPRTSDAGWAAVCVAESDYEYEDETRSIHIDRVDENGIVYFAADVQLKSADQFHTAFSGGEFGGGKEKLSSMAKKAGAVLAVNADNYGAHEYGVIIRDGTLHRARETTRNMLIVDQNGDLSVRSERKGENPKQLGEELAAQGVRHTFEFGPELVKDGAAVKFNPSFNVISTRNNRREPRTAMGQMGPLHYLIIVADGRQEGYSKGMTLQELQQLFVEYGAQTAMNLDGGGTAELWLNGEILNRPSGGEERSMSDMIWF